ncbi:MAG: DUF2298 domain-containing protein [Candidatus Shapirobacteria bacterium]|nr:DUF2298 domain-containing protein [Candidatus Woesebacteria bacterium]
MLADFKYIFIWWLTTFLLSTLSLPLAFSLFKKFWDKGYIFAKTLSFFLISFVLLILGIAHILPFTSSTLIIVFVLYGLANLYFFAKNIHEFKSVFRQKWKIFLVEELLFFVILTLWSFVRGFAPDIEGLEKFMDWGFVNSILRSHFFPPADMWYANYPINYYYFGHFVFAFITKVSGINSAITYNLSIATLCALSFVSTFSLTSNLVFHSLKKPLAKFYIIAGILSAFLLTFGGNFHLIYRLGRGVLINKQTIAEASQQYWYPDATRFIGFDPDTTDKNIHEFPIYSFVVADLHGHLNDLPWVIFITAFFFSSFVLVKSISPLIFIPSGLFLSIAYMTNAWDFAVYGLLFALTLLFVSKDFKNTFIMGVLTIIAWFIFTLPFSLNFTPMTEGLRFSDVRTPFYQLFILYGGFWLICFPLLFFLFKNRHRQKILSTDYFVSAIIILATILVIIPEIGYIKDIYVFDYRRANTMFKLVYQAFILYSISAGYVFIRLRKNIFYKLLFCLVFIIHMSYTYFPIKSYYGLKNYQGLWGLNFIKNTAPDNLEAIDWLNQNVSGQPHIIEAQGDSYTTFNQVSASTGLPTIQGWLVHEWLWRGGYEAPAARQQEVDQVYQYLSNNQAAATDVNPAGYDEYIVQPGDSLWKISEEKIGNGNLWTKLVELNNIKNPSIIQPLQKILIPTNGSEFNQETTSDNPIDLDQVKNILNRYQVKYVFIGDKEWEKYPDINLSILDNLNAKEVFRSGQTHIFELP